MVGARSRQSVASSGENAPASARTGPLVHPGVLVLLGVAVLLGAYALGYLPQFGSLLEDAVRSSRSTDLPALNPAVYGIAGLAAFFILLGVLRSIDILFRKLSNTNPLKVRPLKSVEQFIEEAAAARISLRVARESYYLLEPHYPHKMCIDLQDSLRGDLLLADEAIRTLDALLLTRCDRRPASIHSPAPPTSNFVTVFDLLHRAEIALPLRADRSGSRERAVDSATAAPMPERRQSDSAERKALHAATLLAIESGSLHSEGASGLHRRSSDYNGPRRRATDNRADSEYKGPFQRSTDRPRISSPERHAQPAPGSDLDPAELNRRDPLFIPPHNKRVPEPTR